MNNTSSKAIWQSKTIWFNFFVLVLATVELQMSLLRPAMPAGAYVWTAVGLAMANAGLRFLTTQSLTVFGGAPGTAAPARLWWKDPVLWFNFLAALLVAAESKLGLIQATVPAEAHALVAFAVALANVVLRFWVTQAVTLREQAAAEKA